MKYVAVVIVVAAAAIALIFADVCAVVAVAVVAVAESYHVLIALHWKSFVVYLKWAFCPLRTGRETLSWRRPDAAVQI